RSSRRRSATRCSPMRCTSGSPRRCSDTYARVAARPSMRRLLVSALVACGHAAPSCPSGAIVLAGAGDVARINPCGRGARVAIRTGASFDVSTMHLRSIAGALVIGPTVGIEEIRLPELREVGGALRVTSNGSLRGLYLPQLERAGRIEIDGNVSLV